MFIFCNFFDFVYFLLQGSSSGSGGKPAGMAALAACYKSNLSAPVVAPKILAPPSSKLKTTFFAVIIIC